MSILRVYLDQKLLTTVIGSQSETPTDLRQRVLDGLVLSQDEAPTRIIPIPSVHLNGTGRTTLLREYNRAAEAVHDAIEAVGNITVHGRDYYVQPVGADGTLTHHRALTHHRDMLTKLREVLLDLQRINTGIYDQGRAGWSA